MAGLIASMAVKWALDKLASFLPPPAASSSSPSTVSTVNEGVELLRRLERTMRRILATLHDAEEHWNIREESAKLRLKELKELAYDAEDVVEEYENEVYRWELQATETASISNSKRKRQEETHFNAAGMVPVPMELVVQAKKIIERFDEIKQYSINFSLSENDGEKRFVPDISTLRKTSSVIYEKSIIGREEDKNKIVELMSIEGNNVACPVHVLAIIGMGELGKTTLAQLVYNDPRVRRSFDVFAWVCVSEKFDVSTITKNIISSITKVRCDLSELTDLQEKLVDNMQEKRVLLVLDDVWNERSDMWLLLRVPMLRARICNIIVTTRNEAVAKLVQTMPSYRINSLSPDESWSLFKQGSLAVHQDNDTPKNLVDIGKNIVAKCKGLPLAIKTLGSILRCETDEVRWRDVLESKLWDLEELRSGVLPALELSYKHMPIYLKRCFVALSLFPKDYPLLHFHVIKLWKSLDLLQCDRNGTKDDIGRIYFNELVQRSLLEEHTMHDLIHDLACFLGAEEFFRIEGDTSIEIPPTVRYISTNEHGASVKTLTLPHSTRAILILDGGILQEGLHLNSKKLRVITHMNKEKSMLLPRGIGCRINLHTLPIMEISSHRGNIRELQSLNKIRKLSLRRLGNVACIEDAKEAQLRSKKYLRSLVLWFDNRLQEEAVVTLSHEQLLESLQPHHVLRKLEIVKYESRRFPSWLGNALFSNLTEIRLVSCNSRHLPAFGQLSSLKSLDVYYMDQVEYIGREFCSHIPGVKGFPSLTHLKFQSLRELSEWSEMDVGEFPCLQTVEINYAPKLRSLPPVPFMSLVTLRLFLCESLITIPASTILRKLYIKYCRSLHQLPALVSLWKLEIEDCPKLSAVGSLPSLTTLDIRTCIFPFDDEEILDRLLNCHSSLESIFVKCDTTTCIILQPQSLPSLTKLYLSCRNLQYCDGLAGLTSLQALDVRNCPKLPYVVLDSSTTVLRFLWDFGGACKTTGAIT